MEGAGRVTSWWSKKLPISDQGMHWKGKHLLGRTRVILLMGKVAESSLYGNTKMENHCLVVTFPVPSLCFS